MDFPWWAALALFVLFVIVLYLIVLSVLHAIDRRRTPHRAPTGPLVSGFPLVLSDADTRPVTPLANDGPGRYRVVGVIAASGADTKMYVDAETLANAKVKAELRGIIVTDIFKE